MTRTQEITLDVYEAPYFVYVNAKQQDNDSRILVITLTDQGNVIKPDHTSDEAVFRARKPDGTCVLEQAVIGEDGKVTVALSDQALAVPGDVEADIAVVNGDDILSTASFYIQVARAPVGQEIASENDFLLLLDARDRAEEAAGDAAESAETAGEHEAAAGQYAADAGESAWEAAEERTAAETAARKAGEYASAAQKNMEAAKESAETAKQYSGNPAVIGKNDTWEIWDAGSGAYTDTKKPSRGEAGPRGEPGFSPTVDVTKEGKKTTVTITDKSGPHVAAILDGEDGAGEVTGVKGNAEQDYRIGDVNITAENIGAYTKEETDEKITVAGVRCGITITFDGGFKGKKYTLTDGAGETYTGTVPDGLSVFVNAQKPNTKYTLTCEASNGQTYTGVITTGQYFGLQTFHLGTWMSTIKVTAVSGAKVTVTLDGAEKGSAECGPDGTASIQVYESGNYQVSATYSGAVSDTKAVNAKDSGMEYSVTVSFMTISVTTKAGATITVTEGATSLSSASAGGPVLFYIPRAGTWGIIARDGVDEVRSSVRVSAYIKYSMTLDFPKVFGVAWDYSNPSTALSRLKTADDPNWFVNVDITREPVAMKNGVGGSSPFDAYMPWMGMEEYNIDANGTTTKSGTVGFSRTSKDTMVYIPAFWYAVKDDPASHKRFWYVADKKKSGFEKHPGSGRYVSRYEIAAGYVSRSGLPPLVSITRATVRSNVMNKGTGWYQYDYATWCAVLILYLVEFANWDSQTTLGRGNVDNAPAPSYIINSGCTDAMTYHTGWPNGTNGKTAVQYRHIENPFGNVTEHCDGVNFNSEKVYVCLDPSRYRDDTAEGYTEIGAKSQTTGTIKSIGFSSIMPWAFYPAETGGSDTTYIPDYASADTGWRVFFVSLSRSDGSYCGLFTFLANCLSSHADAPLGARMIFVPQNNS